MREVSMDEYKQLLVGVLEKIDYICRSNNLQYSIFYGTLLGAVRHHGFIPWDDDVDIVMPIEDYDLFCDLVRKGSYGINIIRPEENMDTCFPFGKVCDIRTSIQESNLGPIEGYGAYVDVFPFYRIPSGTSKWDNMTRWLTIRRFASYAKLTKYTKSASTVKNNFRFLEFQLCKFFNPRKLALKDMREQRDLNEYVLKNNLQFTWGTLIEKGRFPSDIFVGQKDVEFEGRRFLGTSDPDKCLRLRFGDNYMTPPPESERIAHHYLRCYIND